MNNSFFLTVFLYGALSFFISFGILRIIYFLCVRNFSVKYFIIDTIFYSVYYGIVSYLMVNDIVFNSIISAILLLGFIPISYAVLKGFYLNKYNNKYYYLTEGLILFLGFYIGMYVIFIFLFSNYVLN